MSSSRRYGGSAPGRPTVIGGRAGRVGQHDDHRSRGASTSASRRSAPSRSRVPQPVEHARRRTCRPRRSCRRRRPAPPRRPPPGSRSPRWHPPARGSRRPQRGRAPAAASRRRSGRPVVQRRRCPRRMAFTRSLSAATASTRATSLGSGAGDGGPGVDVVADGRRPAHLAPAARARRRRPGASTAPSEQVWTTRGSSPARTGLSRQDRSNSYDACAVGPDRGLRGRGVPDRVRIGRELHAVATRAARPASGPARRRPSWSRTAPRARAWPARPRRWRHCPPGNSVVLPSPPRTMSTRDSPTTSADSDMGNDYRIRTRRGESRVLCFDAASRPRRLGRGLLNPSPHAGHPTSCPASLDACGSTRPTPRVAEPPFDQLRTQMARRAASGDLPPGTKLPTVRALAARARAGHQHRRPRLPRARGRRRRGHRGTPRHLRRVRRPPARLRRRRASADDVRRRPPGGWASLAPRPPACSTRPGGPDRTRGRAPDDVGGTCQPRCHRSRRRTGDP